MPTDRDPLEQTAAGANPATRRRFRLLPGSTVDKKLVMAVTGLVWAAFLLVHVFGNLTVFLGRDAMNRYAMLLHESAEALLAARLVLYGALVLHVAAALDLTLTNAEARSQRYERKIPQRATLASRTLRWTGVIILAFVAFHILHFTTGTIRPVPFHERDVYANVTGAFHVPWVVLVYLVAMAIVGMHVVHGVWAAFKSLGLSPLRAWPFDRRLAWTFALVVWVGFSAIPAGVAAGGAG